jgi:uncharacterized membrane protein
MTAQTGQADEVQRYVVRPHRSLSWGGTKWLFFGFAVLMGAFAAYFVLLGAWMVLPFFGLELSALGLGLYLSSLSGSHREVIEISGQELSVARGRRGPEQVVTLPRYWSRVVLSTDPRGWYSSRLMLIAHGQRVEIGAALVNEQRRRLAAELARHLRLGSSLPKSHPRRLPTVPGGVAPAPQVQRESTWP